MSLPEPSPSSSRSGTRDAELSAPRFAPAVRRWSGLIALLLAGLAIRLVLMPVEAFVYDRRAFTEWMVALQVHPL
ncbi:MAG TPA: hypothetical protein VNP95_14790, partial [Thermomicrobiales bacterium]|nr:hypothetical protein [Thermomicrobiales bacterium]